MATLNQVFELVDARLKALVPDALVIWFEGALVSAIDESRVTQNLPIVLLGYGTEDDFVTVGSLSRAVPEVVLRVSIVISLMNQPRSAIERLNDLQDVLTYGLGPPQDGTPAWYRLTNPVLLQVTVGRVTSTYDAAFGVYAARNIPLSIAHET